MKYKIHLFWLILISILRAGYFDTGFIEFTQSDGSTFIGRSWGNEFLNWNETIDGYRFVKINGVFYYAVLSQEGDFSSSELMVGIDSPPSISYKLKRSEFALQQIQNRIDEFNIAVEANALTCSECKLGIVLVDFSDVSAGISPMSQTRYKAELFENILFSSNHFWHQEAILNNQNEWDRPREFLDSSQWVHPEGHALYGSLSDYYHEMSLGQFSFS